MAQLGNNPYLLRIGRYDTIDGITVSAVRHSDLKGQKDALCTIVFGCIGSGAHGVIFV